MKHLKVFNSVQEFEAAEPSLEIPYVVLNEGEVVYSNLPSISEDDLTKGEFVDLGLSVNWATCNLGADRPCDYGKYYQWGDTVGYTGDEARAHSTWATAPFNNGSSDYNSGYFASVRGTVCPNDTLAPEYDAVTVALGSGYRMPTIKEITELINLGSEWCTCTFLGEDHVQHTVYGRKFTGNGNTIFIPAAGYVYNGSFGSIGYYGSVWATSLYAANPSYGRRLYFYSGSCGDDANYRCVGRSVRGILNK